MMNHLILTLLAMAPSATDTNLLSFEAGGVALFQPWEGVRTPEAFIAVDPNFYRQTGEGKSPIEIVYELEQRSMLVSIDVSFTRQEGSTPTTLDVQVSSAGPAVGFVRVATLTLKAPSGRGHATFAKETLGRWVRLGVAGKDEFLSSEIINVLVNGHPLEPSAVRSFTGAWHLNSNNGVLRLASDGAAISGCATWPDRVWSIRGTAHGRTAELTWQDETAGTTGSAIAALGDDGALRGRSRDDNGSREIWLGLKRPDVTFDCRAAVDDQRLAHRLRNAPPGNLTLAGVSFDPKTDELRLDERNDLVTFERQLAKPGHQHARVFVFGRSTEPPADELKRCERRAQRLLAHLQQAGVRSGALEVAVGIVKLNPVQVEPRVEVMLTE